MPVRFRPAGDADWRDARSENISQSGVLFRSDRHLTPETEIEMLLTFGDPTGDSGSGTLLCRGRVVRIERGNYHDPRAGMAATIACRQACLQGSPRRI